MTYATTTPTPLSLRQRWAELQATWARSAARRRLFRATLGELDRMSDRDLADIGLHRSLVREVARQASLGA